MDNLLLRVENLNIENTEYGQLKHVSFHMTYHQSVGFMGLNRSGQDLIIKILTGRYDFKWSENRVYFCERRVNRYRDIQKNISFVDMNDEVLEDWSVAEFLNLARVKWYLSGKELIDMQRRTERELTELGIELDASKLLRELDLVEHRAVRILKELNRDTKILIIEDDCENLTNQELERYAAFIRKIECKNIGVLFNTHWGTKKKRYAVLCKKWIVLRRGRAVKKWCQTNSSLGELQTYILGDTMSQKVEEIENIVIPEYSDDKLIYEVHLNHLGPESMPLCFFEGKIHTIVSKESNRRLEIFYSLSGRKVRRQDEYWVNGRKMDSINMRSFLDHRIGSLRVQKGDMELFEHMTVRDNLIIPVIRKLKWGQYFFSGASIGRAMYHEVASSEEARIEGKQIPMQLCRESYENDKIVLAMSRWFLFCPRIFIICDPFLNCDAYGITVMRSYIKQFAGKGIAVILLTATREDASDLTDSIVEF